VFNSNFCSISHHSRDIEVFLENGNDVMAIPPLGGAINGFLCWILKDRPTFCMGGLLTYSPISNRFEVIQLFQLGWEIPIPRKFWGVFRVKRPQKIVSCNYKPQKALPYTRPRRLSYYVQESVHGFRRDAIPRKKNNNKSQDPYISPSPGAATADTIETKFGSVGVLRNVITHTKFETNRFINGSLAKG